MKTSPSVSLAGLALAGLLACGSAIFLDEPALAELAEREGYAVTGQAVHRARRQADECRCPPPPPPPPFDDDGMPPPPPPPSGPSGPDSSSEEAGGDQDARPMGRPGQGRHGPPPPRGCWPPPPPGPHGPPHHHHHHRHRWGGEQSANGPACELRPLFRAPDKFNFTARVVCFERWEREQAKQLGMTPEDSFDMSKFKPYHRKSLMWNKGCDMQCHFSELELLADDGDKVSVDAEALSTLLKEEGDGSDMTSATDAAVRSCMATAAELLHVKQVCQSGADELLFCLQRSLEETCPGAKWKGQRTCDEVADVSSKLRPCRWMHHPHPPPFFDGRRGPPMGPMGPMGPRPHFGPPGPPPPFAEWPGAPGAPGAQPNTIPGDSADGKTDA